MIVVNELTEKLAAVNIILTHYKLRDDVIDGDKTKRVAIKILAKAYNKAKALTPEVDEAVRARYEELRECEKARVDSVDRASHPFASMMKDIFTLTELLPLIFLAEQS
jgi:hypothetical protein